MTHSTKTEHYSASATLEASTYAHHLGKVYAGLSAMASTIVDAPMPDDEEAAR